MSTSYASGIPPARVGRQHVSFLGFATGPRTFAAAFLGFAILFGVVSALLVWVEQRLESVRDHTTAEAAVAEAARQVEAFVRTEAGNVRVIARDVALLDFVKGNAAARPLVEREFSVFMEEKPAIAQLRILDLDGREMVRVDRVGDRVATVGDAELQDKSARYYFSDAVGLPANGVYLSELDLNVERGVIETPWRPMLRLASPVPGPAGTSAALVVMNLDASFLLETVEGLRVANDRSVSLLNDAGYWLAGVSPEMSWGFMFGRETSLAASDPDLWSRIGSVGSGTFSFDGMDYVVQTVRPADVLSQARAGLDIHLAAESWILLASVPGQAVIPPWIGWPRTLVALGLSALLGGFATRIMVARRRSEDRRRLAEIELVRADRLAGLGSIVAGVAHELNTPLGNARTVATTLPDRLDDLEKKIRTGSIERSALDEGLQEIRDGTGLLLKNVTRAAEIVGHFKNISADQAGERRRAFRLDEFVSDMVHIHRPQFRGTRIALDADIRCASILDGYPGPLGQVVANLIANVQLHAFGPDEEGRVTVLCRAAGPDVVELIVRDSGRGMEADVLERIFDPFFTTRLGGDGSGIGMAIVHNIVTGLLGGDIVVTSSPGAGTSVVVRLPVMAPQPKADMTRSEYDVRRN